jgi:hypothetical protein
MDQIVTTTSDLTVRPAACRETDISALKALAQAAVNVELFTIPLYMSAMCSIQGMHQITGKNEALYQGRLWPGPATTAKPQTANEKAFNIIFSVFIEEMLHLQAAANLASRAGVKPTFTSSALQNEKHGWTCYGPNNTVIPHIVDLQDTSWSNVKVNIGALTAAQLSLFEAIEQPETAARKSIKEEKLGCYFPSVPFKDWQQGYTADKLPRFGTIGYMYECYYKYMNLCYEDNHNKKLWEYVYQPSAIQRDLFNVETNGHPKREYCGFDTTITRKELQQVWDLMSAITDQGEGSELPLEMLASVKDKYQASKAALEANYPSFSDTGQPVASRDAAARFDSGGDDHYERFTELAGLVKDVRTWPDWRKDQPRPWQSSDLITDSWQQNKYDLPKPETIAAAMNNLGCDSTMFAKISQAAVGSIAGITTVLNDYWTKPDVLFPYPSMAGSGDRLAICWALFRKAPDLSGAPSAEVPSTNGQNTLQHACQALDFANGPQNPNDCAAVEIFHSCRGSNDCKAQGGCGFVQEADGKGQCGFALIKAKTDGDAVEGHERTLYSAPSDNKCGSFGGCAVPISASQIMPRGGHMQLFDFVGPNNNSTPFDELVFRQGEKVYDVAYRAYEKVMAHRKQAPPAKPAPNDLRLAFPPST